MGRMIMMRERCIHLLLALYDYNISTSKDLLKNYIFPTKLYVHYSTPPLTRPLFLVRKPPPLKRSRVGDKPKIR